MARGRGSYCSLAVRYFRDSTQVVKHRKARFHGCAGDSLIIGKELKNIRFLGLSIIAKGQKKAVFGNTQEIFSRETEIARSASGKIENVSLMFFR